MEALTFIFNKASMEGAFKGIKVSNTGPTISHLLYADDALILGEWSKENIETTARLLRIFHLCSGLKININKSHIFGIGVSDNEVQGLANVLGCKVGAFPFVYLGIKVGANMNRVCHWSSVVDTVKSRLSKWKANSLSMGGRLTLIKSVLASLPIYYLSMYKAPVAVINLIEGCMKNFLWASSTEDRRVHWVSWDTVTTTKENGGLGISKLADVNMAMIAKWAWRFTTNPYSLWRQTVEAVHGGRSKWVFLPVKTSLPGCWKSIATCVDRLKLLGKGMQQFVRAKVGNGSEVDFWNDLWFGDTTLKDRWPRLYDLEKNKRTRLNNRIKLVNAKLTFNDNWGRGPRTVEELSELRDLNEMLGNFSFSDSGDKWGWGLEERKDFTVSNVKLLLRTDRDVPREHWMKWESWVPLKVNLHTWRVEMDRVPTRSALVRRQMNIQDVSCVLCEVDVESSMHTFTGCGFAYGVWLSIERWCRLDPIFVFDVKDLLMFPESVGGSKWAKKIVRGIIMTACWAIWRARNLKAFEGVTPKVNEVIANIKSLSFLWIRSRSKFKDIQWKDWNVFPMYML